jgi:DNA-binding HxlR family transcriptional regulator
MAAEVFCSRWTALVVRELLLNGSTRFNDIKRGLPRMSPTLLSKRLKELEKAGVIVARKRGQAGIEYNLTEAGEELRDMVISLGVWGRRWIEASLSLKNLDPSLLMLDMRRRIATASFPDRRCTVEFLYPELGAGRKRWWLVVDSGDVDLCIIDPGYEVDLYVRSSLRTMTAVWMGFSALKSEIEGGNIMLTGDETLANSMHTWLGLSMFANERGRIAS